MSPTCTKSTYYSKKKSGGRSLRLSTTEASSKPLYLSPLLKSFKLEIRFINIKPETLTFTDIILVEQILRNFRSCFKILECIILYRTNIKDAPTFNVFKRPIKPFLRVRKDASLISDYLDIYICSVYILISLK